MADITEEVLLTQEGYDKLKAELDYLVSVKTDEVAARLKEAISYGDLSENSEYDAAKNEQAELAEKIYKVENMIKNAKIVDSSSIAENTVGVGVKVVVRNTESGADSTYEIVGTTETDPFTGKISNASPMGAALLNKKVGEQFELTVPAGTFKYEIISVEKKQDIE